MERPKAWRLGELAVNLQVELRGDPDYLVEGLQTLRAAGPRHISFLANPRYQDALVSTQAGAVLLQPEQADNFKGHCLITPDPYLAYAKASRLFEPLNQVATGVHASAVVHESVVVPADVSIGPMVVIGEQVHLGSGCILEAGCVIGEGCTLGEGCHVFPRVTIYPGCRIGKRVRLHAGSVIGADGFGFAPTRSGWVRVAQLGAVDIGDDCDIGANTTIDRGALGDTILEQGVIIDNQVQIAHNVIIGAHSALAACVGISGSSRLGKRCVLAGGVGLVGHIELADDVHITGMSMVTKSILKAGSYSSGTALEATRDWKRTAVRLKHLESIQVRLAALEAKMSSSSNESTT
ncbi:MAG: UDP-3-O-(3-hydroxymyristoyl)glucosamine N-acyltransferase [Pseudomonadales bacterium]|nr:UDP-3-O-(3-hydroxymyristoyl)glucosamine N-acyltransferase [Pseudomonadales bacterium]